MRTEAERQAWGAKMALLRQVKRDKGNLHQLGAAIPPTPMISTAECVHGLTERVPRSFKRLLRRYCQECNSDKPNAYKACKVTDCPFRGQAMKKGKVRWAVIRGFCLRCMGNDKWSAEAVRKCWKSDCPLFAYRLRKRTVIEGFPDDTKPDYPPRGKEFPLKPRKSVYCEVCHSKNKCGWHHITPRSEGGGDNACNLIYLCGKCHDWTEVANYRNRGLILSMWDEENNEVDIVEDESKQTGQHKEWRGWVYGGAARPHPPNISEKRGDAPEGIPLSVWKKIKKRSAERELASTE